MSAEIEPRAAYDVAALRRAEFPDLERRGGAYLNTASAGPVPVRARRALDELAARMSSPDAALYEAHRAIPRRARRLCADLIGAEAGEIALGFNTTYGINLAAGALPLEAGDRVLLLDGDFPANVYPWLNLARRGVEVERVPRDGGRPNEAAALERLARGDVRACSISAVCFCTGFRLDLDAMSRECRRHGTYLVVDAIQAAGAVPLDVSRTPVDILACGGQKWLLSPQGAGFAYVRRGLIDELRPASVGWLGFEPSDDYEDLLDYSFDFLPDARRFELGSQAFASLAALCGALELILELGVEGIADHVRAIRRPLEEWVESRRGLEWAAEQSAARRSGIAAIRAADPRGLNEALAGAGMIASVREGALRLSVHAFNTREEMEAVVSVLDAELGRG